MSGYSFVDQVSRKRVTAHFGDNPGIEHPGCQYRAEACPEYDAFFCRHCGMNGRMSGAWFMDMLNGIETS